MKRSRLHRSGRKAIKRLPKMASVFWENKIPPTAGMHAMDVYEGETKKKQNVLSVLRHKRDYHKEKISFYDKQIKELRKV
jgi:hypothetical protein